jgi:hypothetical protein
MGDSREMAMWAWLEKDRENIQNRWVEEIKAIVNSPDFCFGEAISLPDFYEWCMEHYDEKRPVRH